MTTGHWASHVTIVCEDIAQIAKLSQAPAPAPAGRAELALFSYNPTTPTWESLFSAQLAFNLAHSNSANHPAHAS